MEKKKKTTITDFAETGENVFEIQRECNPRKDIRAQLLQVIFNLFSYFRT